MSLVGPGPGAGMITHIHGGKFLLIGCGFQAVFRAYLPKSTFTGIFCIEEKAVVKDAHPEKGKGDEMVKGLRTLRVLNGDETRSGKFAIMPNEEPNYGGFSICVTISAQTMIAEVEVYSLEEE